jgi:recombinational DNA repair protein RecT
MALDLTQFQQLLDSAQKADAFKADVKRALKKVSSLLVNLQTAVEDAETLMSDDYTPTVKERKTRSPRAAADTAGAEFDPEAPYGRKKDGTPKNKPGRSK